MDREPPPVTVTSAGGAPPADVLEHGPVRSRRVGPTAVLVVLAVGVLTTAVVQGRGGPTPPVPRPAEVPPASDAPQVPPGTSGITATASLAGAPVDDPYGQRLTLTVDLPSFDARNDPTGQPLGDEVVLVGVRVRGFAVEPDDPRSPLPLGRFGRSTSGRSTTVPLSLTAVVADCAVEPQARRDLVLTVRTGPGPDSTVRVASDPGVVRALDRLVARTCRRPRG